MLNKKHVLAVALAGVASLVVASNASAAVYLGGDLGWGTTHQTFSKADINGFTAAVGAMGYNSTSDNSGIAGRIFGGIDVNQYFALESGFTKFSNSNPKVNANGVSISRNISTYAVDLVGKATLPLQDGFSIFAKLGGAYLNETNLGPVAGISVTKKTQSKVLPTYGAGMGYEINKSFATDISWNRIQAMNTKYLQSTDFVGVGLTYRFG